MTLGAAPTVAQLMPTPQRPSRRPWVIGTAVFVALVAGASTFALITRPGETASQPLGPPIAAAARECRTAIGAEAKRRVDAGARPGSGVVSTVSDVTVSDPQWGLTRRPWTIDGTVKFSIASMFGVVPTVVDMRCTAIRAPGRTVSTAVANR